MRASAVLAAARAQAADGALGGSTISGTPPTSSAPSSGAAHAVVIAGSTSRAVVAGVPWRAAATCGAVAIVLAGLATAWRGPRWPVMSARFDRTPAKVGPGGSSPPGKHSTDSATMWESLSRGVDPTVEDGSDPRNLENQLGGGTPG
jgi:hypothetical protein